jgi:TM2 domain-containing membrane protein YozV
MFDVGIVGYPTITTTKSFDLDGVNGYLTAGNVLDKTGTSAFSISTWVKVDTLTSTYAILSKRNGAGNAGYLFYLDSFGLARFYIESTGGGVLFCFNTSGISTGTWTLVTVTYSGSGSTAGVDFYINATHGTTTTTTNTFSGTASNSTATKIGSESSRFYLDGKLYDVIMWNKKLSGTEVTELYNSGTPIDANTHSASANIQAYWRMGNDEFDDGTGTTGKIMDRAGAFNATPTNTESGDITTDAP